MRLFGAVLLVFCSVVFPAAASCDYPALFNFGDSNSDTGGLSAAFGPAPSPNGETFFGGPPAAENLGLPYVNAYLDSVGSNFSHGANFATAGSSIRRQNSSLFKSGFSPFSLDVQSWQFSQFKARSQLARQQGSVFRRLLPEEGAFSTGLYTFDIGMNDLTSSFFSNQTVEQVLAGIPQILNEFATAVKSVYGHGGRYFWIHNAGPFGCLAYVLERLPVKPEEVDPAGCAAPYNAVAQAFNEQLKATVVHLRQELPSAALTYVDVYAAKYSLISNPPPESGKSPRDRLRRRADGEWYAHGARVLMCRPSRRIIWDGVHYTEAANRWVFDQISGGAFSDPPLPLRMACTQRPPVS
ncbi:unnamed protein product [Spirodela intermedia]|uniref:Uncharacterized protein n=1 Tax=Spirodela intermedia TaxID=51605 RepID=A0A7I8J1T4_SPIIN|nr:unnamed protein product [Spirodela intermedia]CAA6664118.1 unnamed protein product [Spirodela intermedia]